MEKQTKNDIIYSMVDDYGLSGSVREQFLDRFLDSDVDLVEIDNALAKYKEEFQYTMYKWDNGKTEEESISIQVIDDKKYGTSGVYHVLVNNDRKAYLKSSPKTYVDDVDVCISKLGKVFGVDTAEINKVVDVSGGQGILSFDIKTNDNAKYVSLNEAFVDYYKEYSKGRIKNLKWITELLSLPDSSKDEPFTREDYIKTVIDMGINILQDYFELPDEQVDKLSKQYVNILLFDYVTNQSDRSLDNVNLVFNGNEVDFAPLYDSGRVYDEKIGKENIFLLDHVCNRQAVIKTLFKYYYDDIKDNIDMYVHKDECIDEINSILKDNLSDKNFSWYYRLINKNLDQVTMLNNRYSVVKKKAKVAIPMEVALQYGYVKTFSVLLSSLLALLLIVVLLTMYAD